VSELSLVDKVLSLHLTLDDVTIVHAVGGALAFAYYGEPRATVDIDVNLFVSPDRYRQVVDILEPLGIAASDADAVVRDGQARLWWGRTPLDLFFSYDPVHGAMEEGIRRVPFAGSTIPILGPEHLLVVKVVFNRAKDWIDIEQMLVAVPALDLGEVHRWLDRLLGPDDERQVHVRALELILLGDGADQGPGI